MSKAQTYHTTNAAGINIISDYAALVKMRLTSLVVFTAVASYFIASGLNASLSSLIVLAIGGFGVAGASNVLNQVLEKDFDKLMSRTANRPLAANRMGISNAVLFAGFLCIIGVTALASFNVFSAFFGMMAFVLYAFVYTPLKRYSRAAVFVGAIAGAMPMLIGVVAFSAELTSLAILLFGVQFAWQFPHFWAIAFLGNDDYQNAGYKFVPINNKGNISRSVALSSIVYSIVLIGLSVTFYFSELSGGFSTIVLLILSGIYAFYSVQFYIRFDMERAKKLMFSSLIYIPLVLLVLIIDKMF